MPDATGPKVVVVTGASAGIGAEVARQAAALGHSLVLVARCEDALRSVAAQCAGASVVVVADVTRRADVERVAAEAEEAFGGFDVWINNVGRGLTRLPSQLTDDDVDAMMAVNVKSALYGMQVAAARFAARGGGHVINVSSTLGRRPHVVERSAYSAAKHFLNALTASFRDELRASHPEIAVSLVSPGLVYTEFGVRALHGGIDSRELRHTGAGQEAAEVAAVIVETIRSRQPDVYTRAGQKADVLGYLEELTADPDVPATGAAAARPSD
jgi:short-subunit dehydrogenase